MSCEDISCAISVVELSATIEDTGVASIVSMGEAYINADPDDVGGIVIGSATGKTARITPYVYDDQQVNIFQVGKGASFPTEEDFRGGKVLSFANGQDNKIFFNIQYSHRIAEGQSTEFHVHTIAPDNNAGDIVWTLTVSYASVHGIFPTESTISATQTIAANSQDKSLIVTIADPFVDSESTISGIAICSLVRNGSDVGDTYGNAIYVHSLDSHFPIDTMGSRQEYEK